MPIVATDDATTDATDTTGAHALRHGVLSEALHLALVDEVRHAKAIQERIGRHDSLGQQLCRHTLKPCSESVLAMALELSRQIAACTQEPRIASRSVEVDLTDKGGGEACANGMSVDAPIELSSDDEAVAPGPLPAAVAVDDASTEEDEPTPTPTANVPLKEVREARLRHFVA
jgi:hypothetical protein